MKTTDLKFKSKLQPIKDIEERNKAFDALSDEDKRKEIAWDCLQLILDNTVEGSYNEYWSSNIRNIFENDSKKFQKRLLKVEECKVCARGGLMLSQIRLGNSITSKEPYKEDGRQGILKGFNMGSFQNAEMEYEHSAFKHPYIGTSTYKLANIMCNIIINGDFNTKDKTNYLVLADRKENHDKN